MTAAPRVVMLGRRMLVRPAGPTRSALVLGGGRLPRGARLSRGVRRLVSSRPGRPRAPRVAHGRPRAVAARPAGQRARTPADGDDGGPAPLDDSHAALLWIELRGVCVAMLAMVGLAYVPALARCALRLVLALVRHARAPPGARHHLTPQTCERPAVVGRASRVSQLSGIGDRQ